MNVLKELIKIAENKKEKLNASLCFRILNREDALSSMVIGDIVYIHEEQKMFVVTEYDNKKVLIGLG